MPEYNPLSCNTGRRGRKRQVIWNWRRRSALVALTPTESGYTNVCVVARGDQ